MMSRASRLASVRGTDRVDNSCQGDSRARQADTEQHALPGSALHVCRPTGRQRVVVARHRAAEPKDQAGALDRPALDLSRQTYLTVREATEYLRRSSTAAFYKWAQRHGIASCRMGRSLLFLRRDLDEAVQHGRPETAQKGMR